MQQYKTKCLGPTFAAGVLQSLCRAEVASPSLLSPCVGFLCDLIRARLRSLHCSYQCCWGCRVGKVAVVLHTWSHKGLSKFLQKEPPSVSLACPPGWIQITPYRHCSLICQIYSPLAAVCVCDFVEVVHSSFVGIVVQDDGWFSILPSTDLCSLDLCKNKFCWSFCPGMFFRGNTFLCMEVLNDK